MSELVNEILSTITSDFRPLSIVYNPDGYLLRPDVSNEIRRSGHNVFVGNSLEIRVHYELNLRNSAGTKCIYIASGTNEVLPDIACKAQIFKFEIASLFPNYVDKATITKQPLDILSVLYDKHIQGRVTSAQLSQMLTILQPISTVDEPDCEDFGEPKQRLENITLDWQSVETIKHISKIFIEAVKAGKYDDIAETIDNINFDFQHYLDDTYFSSINANPLLAPKCVNGVMPFIKGQTDSKIAFVVVDGMAFWQYMVLREVLATKHISPSDEKWTYSWIPSITVLSRQALFRGTTPHDDYKQSPQNERRLWDGHWSMTSHSAKYFYDGESLSLGNLDRVAIVTVELDEKMHSSTSYRDLLALTEIWAEKFSDRIQELRSSGFTVYLTTDHGNVLAKGFRNFTATERAHLYANGSRGKRHAIFQDEGAANQFSRDLGYNIRMKHHNLWFACQGNESFDTPGATGITHGGTHLFEVVIPFIKF